MTKVVQLKAAAPVVARRAARTPVLSSRAMRKGATVYAISESARPRAGRALYAHTNAALTALGLLSANRPAVSKREVLTLIGQRAVTHHVNEGNMELEGDDGEDIRLTVAGYEKFVTRQDSLDVPLSNAYLRLILDGSTAGTDVPPAQVYAMRF